MVARIVLYNCKAFNMVFNVIMWLLGSFRRFPGCCYAVTKIFTLLSVLGGCQGDTV